MIKILRPTFLIQGSAFTMSLLVLNLHHLKGAGGILSSFQPAVCRRLSSCLPVKCWAPPGTQEAQPHPLVGALLGEPSGPHENSRIGLNGIHGLPHSATEPLVHLGSHPDTSSLPLPQKDSE